MALRTAIIDASKALYRNGQLVSLGVPRGLGLAHVSIIDRGETWEQRTLKTSDVIPTAEPTEPPNMEVWVNKKLIPLTWTTGELTALGSRSFGSGPGVEMVVQSFGSDIFRVNFRTLVDKVISDLRIFVYGVQYSVSVEYAAERYPCKVEVVKKVGTKITLCDGVTPGTDNLEECGWMLGGVIDTALPAGSAEQYASEVTAEVQYKQRGQCWRSIDFVVQPKDSDEQYGPPLVLERGKWSPLFDGSVETKAHVEGELAHFYAERVYQRRGWAKFGDWPHVPGQKSRCNYNDHYFTVTALHRAVVRSRHPHEWHDLATIAGTYSRDMCWLKGQKTHGKGLAPWSGPYGCNQHWVDSESLAMQWLVYGDTFAKRTFDEWVANFYMPAANAEGRELCVCKRMCDVAFLMTGDKKWAERADELQKKLLADIEAGKQITGPLWHPEWCDKTILKDQRRPEGVINGKAYPILNDWRPQQRDASGALIPDNCGPCGEGHLLLQMHRLRTGERIYGANQCAHTAAEPVSTRIWVDKRDDKPLALTVRLGHRISGDIHPTSLRVYEPHGTLEYQCDDIRGFCTRGQDAAGFPILQFNPAMITGPRGKWRVDLSSHALAVYANVSDWPEWQEGTAFKFPAYE
jgi:hypothetical protein